MDPLHHMKLLELLEIDDNVEEEEDENAIVINGGTDEMEGEESKDTQQMLNEDFEQMIDEEAKQAYELMQQKVTNNAKGFKIKYSKDTFRTVNTEESEDTQIKDV